MTFVIFCSQSGFEQKVTKVTQDKQNSGGLSSQVLLTAVRDRVGELANSGSRDRSIPMWGTRADFAR